MTQEANTKNLFICVITYNGAGEKIGERIVDMYHYGTRSWLQNHMWWAMHNGHVVGTTPASQGEIDEYLEGAKTALAEKFNNAA